jgi:RNA polymerase sigma-70 factor (ECF subfamily)
VTFAREKNLCNVWRRWAFDLLVSYAHEELRTEQELARAWLRSGSEASARELVRRLHPRVVSIARIHLSKRDAVEDLVQEAFIRVFDHLSGYDFRQPLEHWVSRITLNVCHNRHRHESTRPELRAADLSEAEQALLLDSTPLLDQSEQNHRKAVANSLIERIFTQLAPDDRLILTLFELEGHSASEVAALTGWSLLNVRMRAFRARRKATKLAAAMRDELDD